MPSALTRDPREREKKIVSLNFINGQRRTLAGPWVFLALLALAGAGCGAGGASPGDAGPAADAGAGDVGRADTGPPPPSLGLNDVSVLFPLPETDDAPGYLSAEREGARGVLLPRAVFDAIPTFPVVPADGLVYTRMRVMAIRFDGCGGVPGACHPEIRMVMQPINANGRARDSALHLFYRLDGAAMGAVVAGLRAARALAPEAQGAPLDVHPALVAQGVEGAYGTALRALVLQHVGAENLVRMTFFLRAPPVQEVWFFGGFDRGDDGRFAAMNIVGVGRGNQRVILTTTATGYQFELTPVAAMPEDGRVLLSSAAATAATDEARRAAVASFLRVENPRRYVPDQLPCAGCHIATYVRAEAQRRFEIGETGFDDDRFTAPYDLSRRGNAADNPSSLRAFGWFHTEPMIAQRTIHESALVLEDLERRYPPGATP